MAMTKKEFYDEINGIITKAMEELNMIDIDLEEVNHMISNKNVYNAEHIKKVLIPRKQEIESRIRAIKDAANAKIERIAKKYGDEIKAEKVLNGGDITDDAKLLNLGIKLSDIELENMFDRHDGNFTMQTLIKRYADQNGIKINRNVIMSYDEIDIARDLPKLTTRVIEYYNKKDLFYDRFIGEGSDFYKNTHVSEVGA